MLKFLGKYGWIIWLNIGLAIAGIYYYHWQYWVVIIPVIFLESIRLGIEKAEKY